tara:strand:+ start:168 stop:434 length:267 start_codon:yes stop_codon:yes gene_type:complete
MVIVMADIEKNLFEVALAAMGSAVLGVFGFFWKISHRVSANEKEVQNIRESASRDYKQLRRDVDYILSKVDSADSKLYSIVKNLPKKD